MFNGRGTDESPGSVGHVCSRPSPQTTTDASAWHRHEPAVVSNDLKPDASTFAARSSTSAQLGLVKRPPARARDTDTMRVGNANIGRSRAEPAESSSPPSQATRSGFHRRITHVRPPSGALPLPRPLSNALPQINPTSRERGLALKIEPTSADDPES
ncbi:unnamed protein product [Rhizoctonia solani]|uniref:Uncharacterized protein n=1 Tax=Rhizoctonia solani TaxID=456999 RepID=A0A8H3HUD5_9AGAM|nr:unnamed protein product [Rhizoctonia solani]